MTDRKDSLSHGGRNFLMALLLATGLGMADWGLGPIGGINFSDADIDDGETEVFLGWVAGLTAEFGFGNPISLAFQPMYVTRGTDWTITTDDVETEARPRLTYLSLPVLLKLKFGNPDAYGYVFGGPNLAYNLTVDADFDELTDDFESAVAPLDVGVEVGAGISFRVAPSVFLGLDGRYTYGFMDVLEDPVGDVEGFQTRDFKVLASLVFELMDM